MTVVIREALVTDWPAVYPIFAAITAAGETYAYPEQLSSADGQAVWMGQGRVVVAEVGGEVVGTATMGPNRPGRGSHIATASYPVQRRGGDQAGRPALAVLGLVVVGTVPGAFRHPERGYVGLHVMFLDLTAT